MRGPLKRILVLFGAVCTAGAVLLPTATAAQAAPSLKFDAKLNGHSTSSLSNNDPLVLRRNSPLRITITVHNESGKSLTVAAARVEGRVMGLSFFSYDTQLNLVVPARSTRTTRFEVALSGLADQADGLLPSTVALLNANTDEIASKDITVDVKGDLTSIYGVFGLAIAAITLLWLISLLYRVSRRALPADRWRRAMQFSAAGFGIGLALTFSVSVLRLLAPSAVVWAPFVLGAGLIGLAVGYVTPGPRAVDPDEEQDFIASRERQYARISGGSDEDYAAARTSQPQLGVPSADPDPAPAPPPEIGRDTTVQASRSDIDSMFGPEYGSDDRDRR